MLTDNLRCDDCTMRGSECECPKYKGPTWSREREQYQAEREKYDALQWWNKIEYWDPVGLTAWQFAGQHRLVPTLDQALAFNLKRNPSPCFIS